MDYTISVMKEDTKTSFLENGFLKCCVTQVCAPFDSRHFIYRLHSYKLGSPSWFADHKDSLVLNRSERSLTKHRNGFSRSVGIISSEVDLLNDQAKLFKQTRKSPSSPVGQETEVQEPPTITPCRRLEPSFCSTQRGHRAMEEDPDEESQADGYDSGIFQRTFECLTECFDRFCFLNGQFYHSSFPSLAQTLISQNSLTEPFSEKAFSPFKGNFFLSS